MFYREGDSVAGPQCVRMHRSLGNVNNADRCPDVDRVGLTNRSPEKAGSFMVATPRSARILEEKLSIPQTFFQLSETEGER